MQRIGLRPLAEDDLDAVVAAAVAGASPPEVMPTDGDDEPQSWTPQRVGACRAFLASRLRPLPDGRLEQTFVVELAGTPCGVARLLPDLDRRAGEMGLWLASSARGRGVGRAVVRLLVDEARSAGMRRVTADTTLDNPAALAILERAGAELEPSTDSPGLVLASIDVGRSAR